MWARRAISGTKGNILTKIRPQMGPEPAIAGMERPQTAPDHFPKCLGRDLDHLGASPGLEQASSRPMLGCFCFGFFPIFPQRGPYCHCPAFIRTWLEPRPEDSEPVCSFWPQSIRQMQKPMRYGVCPDQCHALCVYMCPLPNALDLHVSFAQRSVTDLCVLPFGCDYGVRKMTYI